MKIDTALATSNLQIDCLGARTSDLDEGLDCLDRVKLLKEGFSQLLQDNMRDTSDKEIDFISSTLFKSVTMQFLQNESSIGMKVMKGIGLIDDSPSARATRFEEGFHSLILDDVYKREIRNRQS